MTLAPSRANAAAVALPLPQPGPIEPAPTTSATLSFRRPAMPKPLPANRAARMLTILQQRNWSGTTGTGMVMRARERFAGPSRWTLRVKVESTRLIDGYRAG